jgi:hypothetical protein
VTRDERIKRELWNIRKDGVIENWVVGSPAGRTKWNVWGRGWERTFTTREVEAFLVGVGAGRDCGDTFAARLASDRELTRRDVEERSS